MKGGVASFERAGQPLWSFGVDCTDPGESPSKYDPKNPSYSALRLYPSEKVWVDDTLAKLRAWHFNSLGGWSDFELFRKHGEQRIPYFFVLHLGAYDRAPWHDLFAPQMWKAVDGAAKAQIAKVVDDPYLVGYFTDNELGWWDETLFATYMKMPASSPGKLRLLGLIKRFYKGSFAGFRKDWNTSASSFEALGKKSALTLKPGGNGLQLVNAWTYELGRQYYRMVWEAVRRYDKNHLILGDRYCQYYTLPIVRASKDYIDAVSTNYGAEWNDGSISRFFLDTLNQATGKPVIVSEFYMCAMENRSGNKNSSGGFPIVQTQAERAAGFKHYVESVASLPYMLGAHWFQYYDEPEHGRGDGENYNMGLVDTMGRPYEDLVRAAASIDFAGLRAHASRGSAGNMVRMEAFSPDLKNWPRNASFVPSATTLPFGDLYATWDDGHLNLGLLAMDYMDESLWPGRRIPESERSTWRIEIGGLAKPIVVRFCGDKRKAVCDAPKVEIFENPGLKHALVVRIPMSVGLHTGQTIELKSQLTTHGRKEQMVWRKSLRIDK